MGALSANMEHVVVDFYRDEIRQRYELDRMRQDVHFQGIPDPVLEGLRNFFLERIYPPAEVRDEIQPSLDQLQGLLTSPLRVGLLIRTNVVSVLRLGVHFPAAISAGVTTVETIRATGVLEESMMEAARRLKLKTKDSANRTSMLRIIAEIPEEKVRNVITDVGRLFEALSNVKMLAGVLRILENCLETMKAHPTDYSEIECKGMTLAIRTMQDGHAVFQRIKAKDLPGILKGITGIEAAWYDRVREEAGAVHAGT